MMAALCDPAISTAAVAALIEKEPTMVARVLRVANSSYYGQPRGIRTLERALQLLGWMRCAASPQPPAWIAAWCANLSRC